MRPLLVQARSAVLQSAYRMIHTEAEPSPIRNLEFVVDPSGESQYATIGILNSTMRRVPRVLRLRGSSTFFRVKLNTEEVAYCSRAPSASWEQVGSLREHCVIDSCSLESV